VVVEHVLVQMVAVLPENHVKIIVLQLGRVTHKRTVSVDVMMDQTKGHYVLVIVHVMDASGRNYKEVVLGHDSQ
jgi:hypothetical protein